MLPETQRLIHYNLRNEYNELLLKISQDKFTDMATSRLCIFPFNITTVIPDLLPFKNKC